MDIVHIGSGSFKAGDTGCYLPVSPLFKTKNLKTPIPSNGWWQSILVKQLSDGIVSLPFRLQYTSRGLSIMNPGAGFVNHDQTTVITEGKPDLYLAVENINVPQMVARVCEYGDWSVTAVLSDDDTAKMKTTFVKGAPYIFNEFGDDCTPYIFLNGISTRIFDDGNNSILISDNDSIFTDHVGLEISNTDAAGFTYVRWYGIFSPEGSVFKRVADKIIIQMAGRENYLSLATLTADNDLYYFYQHAYAFVKDTKVNYNCDDASAFVTTTFKVTTQVKRSGFSADTLMCLFPHQWKSTAVSLTGLDYSSIRGRLKVHEGNSFATQNIFPGIIPQFGEPVGSEGYNRTDTVSYIKNLIAMLQNDYLIDDPYWQGKNLHPLTQAVLIADQLEEIVLRDECLSLLKNILTDWFTYHGDPSEKPRFLYYSGEWGAMQGNGGDHGMAVWMSDHHYVWGYFIYAAAILAAYDKEFLTGYGGIVEHLIRDVGNPCRDDSMYPFVRGFDVYEGHSWAGGYGDNYDSNNQEAACEGLLAYVGEYFWGLITNNKAYCDLGKWVYTLGFNSILQYWFDIDGENWLTNYPHRVAGQVWGSRYVYDTYFSKDPNCIYGIHWLPVAPYITFYGLWPEAARKIYNDFLAEKGGPEDGWYHIIWPFQSLGDPKGAIAKWDPDLIAGDDKNGQKEWSNTYWFIHNMNACGYRTQEIWSPNWSCYQVFRKNGQYTAHIWNPTGAAQSVVFRDTTGNIVGFVTVPAMKTITANL